MSDDIPKTPRKKKLRPAKWRFWVQAGFLLVWLDPLMLRLHGVCAPVFHCHSCPLAMFGCPIGFLANACALHIMPFLAIGVLLIVGSLFGTLICGWVCPFGFLQDLLGKIPTPKFRIPGWLGWTRYAVLVGLVLLIPYFFGNTEWFFFCRLCPAGAVEAAVPYSLQQTMAEKTLVWPSATKSMILVGFLLAALFLWRPWCTVLCPLGAVFSLCNYISLVFLRFQPERCRDCDLCRDLCKYRGPAERRGSDMRCIRCLECVNCRALSVGNVFQKEKEDKPIVQITKP
ncbi:MAG: 4Fe-4S binding protein [Pirellulaceae bacterium]|nr:4Fe-4S binding protein [Pirellulaceae bacterium]